MKTTLQRITAALLLAASLAACGGGDWSCDTTEPADGKKAIPAEPCDESKI